MNAQLIPVIERRSLDVRTASLRRSFQVVSTLPSDVIAASQPHGAQCRTLRVSAGLALMAFFIFVALSAFAVVHWAIWIPPAIAALGVALSNAVRLNSLESSSPFELT